MGRRKKDPESSRYLMRKATSDLYRELDSEPKVTEVEWLEDGLKVQFNDGRVAVFSEKLLYENLPDAHGA